MDLGISGKLALVCGSSAGLGYACAAALAAEGARVVLTGRDQNRLSVAVTRLAQTSGFEPQSVCCDVSTAAGRETLIAACPNPDILVNNAGGPAKKDFRELSDADWQSALNANFLSAVELIRAYIDPMIERGWGRIVNITAVASVMPVEQMERSMSARLALTGYVAGVARQVAATGVTINNILPGMFATDRVNSLGALATELIGQVPMKRAGDPREFGEMCAFVCSERAAYLTAQNILLDGGLARFTL